MFGPEHSNVKRQTCTRLAEYGQKLDPESTRCPQTTTTQARDSVHIDHQILDSCRYTYHVKVLYTRKKCIEQITVVQVSYFTCNLNYQTNTPKTIQNLQIKQKTQKHVCFL